LDAKESGRVGLRRDQLPIEGKEECRINIESKREAGRRRKRGREERKSPILARGSTLGAALIGSKSQIGACP